MTHRQLLHSLPILALCVSVHSAIAQSTSQASHVVYITVQRTQSLWATPRLSLHPAADDSTAAGPLAIARTGVEVEADGGNVRLSAGLLSAWDEEVHLHLFGSTEAIDLSAGTHRQLVAGPMSRERVEMEYNAPLQNASFVGPDRHKRQHIIALTLTAN